MATELVQQDDETLLLSIQEGNRIAFAELVERHTDKFYRLAYRYTANPEEAEDMVQVAFLKLWERPTMWQPHKHTKFTTWFYRVIVNLCLDHHKKTSYSSVEDEGYIPDNRDNQEEILTQTEIQSLLEKEISSLPQRQQTALNLCFYEGFSQQEAADIMKVNIKALQSLIMRAKTTLKEKMTVFVGEYNNG